MAYAWLNVGLPKGVELAQTRRAAARPEAFGTA
jgi:hypothetical protein